MRLSLFAAAAMFSVSLAARADTTFTLAGTFGSGAILNGNLTLNTVTVSSILLMCPTRSARRC